MKKILTISIISTFALFAADANATKATANEGLKKLAPTKKMPMNPVVKEGVGYIKMLGKELKMNMKKHMMADKNGVDAAAFCANEATKIEEEVAKKLPEGVKVYRTSLKYRNEKNKPNAEDEQILKTMHKAIEEKKFNDKPIVVKVGNKVRVYKPLLIEAACLKCHGNVEKINPKIKDIVSKKYPNDKAFNYKLGDLRGVIVAEMPAKK